MKKILVINAGSSSLKFELFEVTRGRLKSVQAGQFDNRGKPIKNFAAILKKELAAARPGIIGHRVVHGGSTYTKPTIITPSVVRTLTKLSELAPLHNPPSIECIKACIKLFPHAKQVAVFDTAFHQTMPEKAYLYGLPYSLAKRLHIRRYGFHGISHQYVWEQARKKLGKIKTRRVITCHLGNGCSMAGILDGKVVDTSMGFTPLEGLPMGTRSGDLDPAVIFYLERRGFSSRKIDALLHKKSGLLGVSELSSDVRDLWAAYKKGNKGARRTLEWFSYRIAKYIGAYAAALGGLDCVIFTGGTGENAWYIRRWVMRYLKGFLKPRVLVIRTHEEKKIAEACAKVENVL